MHSTPEMQVGWGLYCAWTKLCSGLLETRTTGCAAVSIHMQFSGCQYDLRINDWGLKPLKWDLQSFSSHSRYALWNSRRKCTFLIVFKENLNSSNWYTKQVISEEKRPTWLIKLRISKSDSANTSEKHLHMCHSIYFVSVNRTKHFFCTKNCFLRALSRHSGLETRVFWYFLLVVSLRLPANDLDLCVLLVGAFVSSFCITLEILK